MTRPAREITGRHVLAVTAGAFAVIIGVNLVMAWKAISTFPGLEVANSYVASQEFDARRKAQLALGWVASADYADGKVRIVILDAAGGPAGVQRMSALVGRTTFARDDIWPAFRSLGGGVYEADALLGRGQWLVVLTATASDGTAFEQRLGLSVNGDGA